MEASALILFCHVQFASHSVTSHSGSKPHHGICIVAFQLSLFLCLHRQCVADRGCWLIQPSPTSPMDREGVEHAWRRHKTSLSTPRTLYKPRPATPEASTSQKSTRRPRSRQHRFGPPPKSRLATLKTSKIESDDAGALKHRLRRLRRPRTSTTATLETSRGGASFMRWRDVIHATGRLASECRETSFMPSGSLIHAPGKLAS